MLIFPSYTLVCTWPSVAPHGSFKCVPIDKPRGVSVWVQGSCQLSSLVLWHVCILSQASCSAVLQPLLMDSGKGYYSLPSEAVGHRLGSSKSFTENPTSLPITSATILPTGTTQSKHFPLLFDKSKGIKSYPWAAPEHFWIMGWVVVVNGLSLGVVKGIINVLWHFSQN